MDHQFKPVLQIEALKTDALFTKSSLLDNNILRVLSILLAAFIYLMSIFFLLLFGITYILLSPNGIEAGLLQVHTPLLSAIAYFACCLLHCYGFFQLLYLVSPTCFKKKISGIYRKRSRKRIAPEANAIGDLRSIYHSVVDDDGPFGSHGQFFEFRLIIRELLEIPAATVQSYYCSWYITNTWVTGLFTLIVISNCLISPFVLRLENLITRRYLMLLLNALFDFIYSMGIFMLIFPQKIFEYYFSDSRFKFTIDPLWVTSTLLDGRLVLVNCLIDLILKLIPFLMCFFSLNSFVHLLYQRKVIKSSKSISLSKQAPRPKRLSRRVSYSISNFSVFIQKLANSKIDSCLHISAIVWGIFVAFVAVFSLFRASCGIGCVARLYPWFNTECKCVYYNLDCMKLNVASKDGDLSLPYLPNSLVNLHINNCHFRNGLDMKVLTRLQELVLLEFRFTSFEKWLNNEFCFNHNLFLLKIYGSGSCNIPCINSIQRFHLKMLDISFSKIKMLPSNISTIYPDLKTIRLSFSQVKNIPANLLQSKKLVYIDFSNNEIAEIPPEYYKSTVKVLNLQNNNISKLTKLHGSNYTLYLDGNPLMILPKTLDRSFLERGILSAANTPVCMNCKNKYSTSALEKLICQANNTNICEIKKCLNKCRFRNIGNGICDLECYHKECKWDRNDCSNLDIKTLLLKHPN